MKVNGDHSCQATFSVNNDYIYLHFRLLLTQNYPIVSEDLEYMAIYKLFHHFISIGSLTSSGPHLLALQCMK